MVREQILTADGVKGATPYLYAQTLLSGATGGNGVVLRGIDPATAEGVVNLSKKMINGSIADLTQTPDNRVPNIILGKNLAEELRVKVGDKVRLISPSGPLTPMGVIPKIKTCRVSGIFESGMYEYDSSLAYMTLAEVQSFLEIGDVVHGIEVAVSRDDLNQADRIAKKITDKIGTTALSPRTGCR